jgi:type I restriction enzyme S subunit
MIALDNVAEIIMGQSPPSSTYNNLGKGWPFFQGKSEFGKINPKANKWCTQPKKIAKAGDILISVRAPVGPTNLADQECCIGRGLSAIRPNAEFADKYFIWYFLQYSEKMLAKKGQGSTFEAISGNDLKNLLIPDLPVEKQHQIASHLKTRLAEVEKVRKAGEIQLQETEKLANAIIFNSINTCKSQTLSLGKVLDEIKQGIGENWADFPVLGATRDGLAPAKSPPGKKPERYKPVFPGTVFYNPMRILIGSIAFVDEDDTPGITSPDYVVLKGKPGIVDSPWFYYWLRSPLGEHCILSLARGAVRERMLFSRLSKGNIELPDFKVQQDAATALAELKPLRRTLELQRDEITQLPQKILAQAFEIET